MKIKDFLFCMVFLVFSVNFVYAEYYGENIIYLDTSLVNQDPYPAGAGEIVEN